MEETPPLKFFVDFVPLEKDLYEKKVETYCREISQEVSMMTTMKEAMTTAAKSDLSIKGPLKAWTASLDAHYTRSVTRESEMKANFIQKVKEKFEQTVERKHPDPTPLTGILAYKATFVFQNDVLTFCLHEVGGLTASGLPETGHGQLSIPPLRSGIWLCGWGSQRDRLRALLSTTCPH